MAHSGYIYRCRLQYFKEQVTTDYNDLLTKPVETGTNEPLDLFVLHMGTVYLRPEGSSL